MRFPENITNDSSLFVDEHKSTAHHKSRPEHISGSIDRKSSPASEYFYTEIVKAIGNNEFIKEKSYLKRVSWSPLGQYESGLPPTGKRTDGLYATTNKASNQIRMRPHATRNPGLQNISIVRPVSFNEKYDRNLLDRYSNHAFNSNGMFSRSHPISSPTPSLSSADAALHIPLRTSPLFDNSDFISDTSSLSSSTTTSLPSVVYSRRKNSNFDRVYETGTQPFVIEYQQNSSKHIDPKLSTPILKTNNMILSSPISSSFRSSITSSSSSSSPISFTCPKGHEESSSSSPIGPSLNQQSKFTTQTSIIDSSREDIGHLTTTTRSLMNMSISPNRQQTYSTNPLNASNRSMTTNNDGLKQQHEAIDSVLCNSNNNSCLKSQKAGTTRSKKSVHFDRQLPAEYRSSLPSTRTHYQLPVTLTSSCICNRTSDNEEQKKKPHSETLEEKEKNEMTRRTIIANITPLTTHSVHRSFSLSPLPPSKKENNDSRTSRQEKKENVDELNCTTPSRQVTTAATTSTTHLYCTPHTTIVTYKDGNYDTSLTKELNGTNHFSTGESLTHSIPEKQMPMMNSSVKTSTTPQQSQTTTKKFIGTGGFFNFIHRSNSNQNKSSSSSPADDSKQLKRTTSTQRRPKQYISNENKRLSADIEPLHTSSVSLSNAWKERIDKVQINAQKERPSTKYSAKINRNSSSNVDSSIPLHSNAQTNRSSISLLTKPANTIMKSNEGDSLNNGLLFQPNEIGKRDSFLLSPSNSFSHANDSSSSSGVSSSIGKMMQTSTLVISTPPQYHYYLYPPTPTKKPATNNRTISNVSMNSISTNSSSSSSSYDSQIHDLDDDTSSCSAYQNKIYQSASYSSTKPVTLSDSVQAFWPPQASLLSPTSLEQNQHSNLIKNKQSEVKTTKKNIRSPTRSNDSSSITTGNQTDVLSPSTSLISNKKEEARSYTEQTSFHSPDLRPTSDTSFEDTPASYTELLRAKSRSITNNRTLTMNVNTSSLSRSRSKDTLSNQNEESNSLNRNVLRPKSAGQTHVQALLSPVTYEISNDFQSKRQFFENRIYSDNAPISACPKVLTLPPTSNPPRHVIKLPVPTPSTESMIRTTKYFDSSASQTSLPPAVHRKPVRIVKAVQRSVVSPSVNEMKTSSSSPSPPSKMTPASDSPMSPPNNNDHHLSSEYVRNLFPTPDHQKRNRSRQNSSTNVNNESVPQTEDLLNLTKRLEIFRENQRLVSDEIEINTKLGSKLINVIESKGEANEIEKFKLHINEIDTITSVLLKLSARLAKVENDLSMLTDDQTQLKASLLDRREKIQQKHDEAKVLKDGIDRRSRVVTNILQKYFSTEQCDDYDHFIRMKSTLLIDAKEIEESIALIEKQLELLQSPSFVNNQSHFSPASVSVSENFQRSNSITGSTSVQLVDNLQTNHSNTISTTA